MKKRKCQKCGKYEYVEEHHILPVSTFGKNNETAFLCSNCHTNYHQLLGSEGLKNLDVKFHFEKYYRWFFGLGVVFLILYLLL